MSRARRHPPTPLVRALSPLRDFLATESAGALLLAGGTLLALVWANAPWSGTYHDVWANRIAVTAFGHTIDLDLRHWVNDGLMTIFFLVVGLEIKREVVDGHLSQRRAATLPLVAAIGGMLAPALLYLAIAGGTSPRGWAVPMATDIALAVGILAVAGDRLPSSLRAFLLGLAIVDDIGAIIVIAAVYSDGIGWTWLLVALACVPITVGMHRLGVHAVSAYVVIGIVMWYGLHEAGVHPTLAGVVMGLLAPSVPRLQRDYIDAEELLDLSDATAARATTELARSSVSVVEWLQHVLHPWTSYVIVPIFAVANAGIVLSIDGVREAFGSPVTWGIIAGLVLGKPLGVVGATWLMVRSGGGDRPPGSSRRQIAGVGAAAGIGFTVALFITELAFRDPTDREHAKVAILTASLLSAAIAAVALGFRAPAKEAEPVEPIEPVEAAS